MNAFERAIERVMNPWNRLPALARMRLLFLALMLFVAVGAAAQVALGYGSSDHAVLAYVGIVLISVIWIGAVAKGQYPTWLRVADLGALGLIALGVPEPFTAARLMFCATLLRSLFGPYRPNLLSALASGAILIGAARLPHGSAMTATTIFTLAIQIPAQLVLSGIMVILNTRMENESRLAEELARTLAHSRSLVEQTSDGILVVDAHGTVQYQNPSVAKVLGYAPDALIGRVGRSVVHPDDIEAAKAAWAVVVAQPDASNTTELRLLHAAGHYIPVEAVVTNLLHDPFVGGLAISVRDISERVRNREAWRHSRRVMTEAEDRLRRNTAEFLHGPLQSKLIVLAHRVGEAMRSTDSTPAADKHILAEIQTELYNLCEGDVRAISHMLHPAVIQLGLIPALRSLLNHYEQQFRVTLTVDPSVTALDKIDRNEFPEALRLSAYRIVEEALNNIRKHAEASAFEVDVRMESGPQLAVSVRDNGKGFSAGPQEGLGMHLIAGRVQEADGIWSITNTTPTGTTLKFSLPLGDPPVSTTRPAL